MNGDVEPGDRAWLMRAYWAVNIGKVVLVGQKLDVDGSCKKHKNQNFMIESLGTPFKTDKGPVRVGWVCRCALKKIPPLSDMEKKTTVVTKKKPQKVW